MNLGRPVPVIIEIGSPTQPASDLTNVGFAASPACNKAASVGGLFHLIMRRLAAAILAPSETPHHQEVVAASRVLHPCR